MTTLSIPVSESMEQFIKAQVKHGFASNKADVVRRAILRMQEEEAIASVLRAQEEVKSGKILKGDLRELMKKIK